MNTKQRRLKRLLINKTLKYFEEHTGLVNRNQAKALHEIDILCKSIRCAESFKNNIK